MPDESSALEQLTFQSILLVNNDPKLNRALKKAIRRAFQEANVETATSLRTAGKLIKQKFFDLLFVDIRLPDGDGVAILRQVNFQNDKTVGVVTSSIDDEQNVLRAFRAGAHGYLTDHSPRELDRYLDYLFEGRPPVSPAIMHRILNYLKNDNESGRPRSDVEMLTERESVVLAMIASGQTVPMVAAHLELSKNTVAHHIKAIYTKLGIHTRAEATAAAIDLGLFRGGMDTEH